MIEKLRAEMAKYPKNQVVQVIGQAVIDHLRQRPQDEALIAESKTILGSIKAMEAEARKTQVDRVGMLTPEQGLAVVLQYFGLEADFAPAVPPKPDRSDDFHVSLDDLLSK